MVQIPVSDVVTFRYTIGGASHALESVEMRGQGGADLAPSLNRLPGVRMETRGMGGSRRIDIRGSGLRSPFGVRNTQILVNGFLLSTADGVGQTEWLDPWLLDRLVVLMGPSGAWLGGSYGGALVGTSLPEFSRDQEGMARVWGEGRGGTLGRGAAGKGGAWRSGAGAQWQTSDQEWTVRFTTLAQPGYRDQEANEKLQGELHWRYYGKELPGVLHHVWLSGYRGGWELPGALDSLEALQSPATAPGAKYDAGVDRNRWQAAYGRRRAWGDRQTGVYALVHGGDKVNPFGTSAFFRGHKVESEWGGSVRGHWSQSHSGKWGWHTWEAGTNLQADRLTLAEWDSLSGDTPQGLRYDLVTDALHGWAGAGYRWRSVWGPWGMATLSLQLGWDLLLRNTDGTSRGRSTPWQERYFRHVPLPRFLYQHHFRHATGWLQWTTGTSHPTTFEWVHPETFTPYALEPEWAHCWEAGVRTMEDRPLQGHFTGFQQRVLQAIGPIESNSDGPLLGNASSYHMRGLETRWMLRDRNNVRPVRSSLEVMAAWHRFEYGRDEERLERRGARLPGLPEWTLGASANVVVSSVQFSGHYRYTGTTPLNDSNSAWAPAQGRMDFEAIWSLALRSGGKLVAQITCINVLNEVGSSWWTVNANQGRFYNPMPPRTWQLGLRWEWERAGKTLPASLR